MLQANKHCKFYGVETINEIAKEAGYLTSFPPFTKLSQKKCLYYSLFAKVFSFCILYLFHLGVFKYFA